MVKNIIVGLLSKSTGFVLVYYLNIYLNIDQLAETLFNITLLVSLQSLIFLPTIHLGVQSKKNIDNQTLSVLILGVCITYLIISLIFKSFSVPVILYLLLNGCLVKMDTYLLTESKSRDYIFSLSFKNILAIVAVVIFPVNFLFWAYFIGEVVRWLLFSKTKNNYVEPIKKTEILKYSLLGFSFVLPLLFIKFFLKWHDNNVYVYVENSLKIAEVIQTSVTAGILPLFLKELKSAIPFHIIKKVNIIGIISSVGAYIFIYLLFNLFIDQSNPFYRDLFEMIPICLLGIVFVNLSFIRKSFIIKWTLERILFRPFYFITFFLALVLLVLNQLKGFSLVNYTSLIFCFFLFELLILINHVSIKRD